MVCMIVIEWQKSECSSDCNCTALSVRASTDAKFVRAIGNIPQALTGGDPSANVSPELDIC